MLTYTFSKNMPVDQHRKKPTPSRFDTLRVCPGTAIFCRWLVVLLALAFLVSGCMVGPDFVKPEAQVEEEWLQQQRDPRIKSEPADYSEWWVVFNDPVLDNLIELASRQNLDLQSAGLRILEARAQLGIAIGSQYPQTQQIGGEANANQLSENAPNGAGADRFYYNYQLGFDAAWEFDFWGRFRRGVESANASLYTTLANYDDILVSLIAEVARTYFDIRTFEQRLVVTRENVTLQEKSLDIAAARYEGGVANQLDATQAEALLRQTQATIPPLEASLYQAKNALAILLGILPTEIQDILGPPKPIPTAPIEVAVGIPAELLRRRPDIRLAEFQAAAQSAQIGIAKADLYPSFSLVGSIGLQSSDKGGVLSNNANFSDLFTSGGIAYFIGPSIQWPIFNYGRLKNNVRVQDARFQQLVVNYQNTVLQAFQDVEDATVGFLRTQEQTGYLSKSVEQYKLSVELSLIQYSEGLTSFQRVIDAQRNLAQQEDAFASATGSVGTNLIALYKALGGGWELRLGKDFIPEKTKEEMRQRTNWGDLLPPADLPEDREEKPPTGQAVKVFYKPDL
jgi:NodT family efflux transporter outer membrane factor (OMF) lipoprotein